MVLGNSNLTSALKADGLNRENNKRMVLKSQEEAALKQPARDNMPKAAAEPRLQEQWELLNLNALVSGGSSNDAQQLLLYSAQKFTLEGLVETGKNTVPCLKALPKEKTFKRHVEEGQDLPQCKTDKSETGLGQTTDISLRTSVLPFRRMPTGGTRAFPSHKDRDVWKPPRVSSGFTADQRKSYSFQRHVDLEQIYSGKVQHMVEMPGGVLQYHPRN